MSDPIMQALDEMQALCDAATEGPWDWLLCVDKATPSVLIAREEGGEVRTFISSLWLDDEDGLSDMSKADADFVASARTDMPRLIAALTAVLELTNEAEEERRAAGPAWDMRQDGAAALADCIEQAIEEALGGGRCLSLSSAPSAAIS